MTFRDTVRREVHVAIHGQLWRFRVMKYIVLISLALLLYKWKGIEVLGPVFLNLGLLAVALHFFFRWKTDKWTKSWWLYKRIPLDGE